MMTDGLALLLGVLLGAIAAWIARGARLQQRHLSERHELHTRAAVAQAAAESSGRQLDQASRELEQLRERLQGERAGRAAADAKLSESQAAEQRLVTTFKALSSEALNSNTQAFLHLARQSLEQVMTRTQGSLGQHQEAIKGLVGPLEEALRRQAEMVQAFERGRKEEYGQLTEQLRSLAQAEGQLQQQTERLVLALRQPHVRGRWGELTLRRVVELAGLAEFCDFSEQVSVDAGARRPDLVVRLPAGRQVVVDAKTPLDAYLDAIDDPDEPRREASLRRHAQQVRAHMTELSSKAYWSQFADAPEFVVMFIPGEAFLNAALRLDKGLLEHSAANGVVLASPTTLIALLKAVAYGWRHERLARNAQEIAQTGRDLYGRFLVCLGRVRDLGTQLGRSVDSFNEMVGSVQARVIPALRRFGELGAGQGELPVIEPVDQTPRRLVPPEPSPDAAEPLEAEERRHDKEIPP